MLSTIPINQTKLFWAFFWIFHLSIENSVAQSFNRPNDSLLDIQHRIVKLLESHYFAKPLDDQLSLLVFEEFLSQMDPQKIFFTQDDLKLYQLKIDDELKAGTTVFFQNTYKRYQDRKKQFQKYYKTRLLEGFQLNQEETFVEDSQKRKFVKQNQLNHRWDGFLKYHLVKTLYCLNKEKELKKIENPELNHTTYHDLEKKAIDLLTSHLDQKFSNSKSRLHYENSFYKYLNAITTRVDPNFRIPLSFSKKLNKTPNQQNNYGGITVVRFHDKSAVQILANRRYDHKNHIRAGEKIIMISKENGDTNLTTLLNEKDISALLYGPVGEKLYLSLQSIDKSIRVVSLTRSNKLNHNKIQIEQSMGFIQHFMVQKKHKSLAYIRLDSFEYGEAGFGRILKSMKQEGIHGVILDLRNNLGGVDSAAYAITGYFLKGGLINRVVSKNGLESFFDSDGSRCIWEGPLVILVNERSASCSELLAATLQDYERGIVMGTSRTYGKGTTNSLNELGLFQTVGKYYRVTGKSTQYEGVHSDIVLPSINPFPGTTARDVDFPYPVDHIFPGKFQPWEDHKNLKKTIDQSKIRVEKDPHLKSISLYENWILEQQLQTTVKLNYVEFADLNESRIKRSKFFQNKIAEYSNDLIFKFSSRFNQSLNQAKLPSGFEEEYFQNYRKDSWIQHAVEALLDWESF